MQEYRLLGLTRDERGPWCGIYHPLFLGGGRGFDSTCSYDPLLSLLLLREPLKTDNDRRAGIEHGWYFSFCTHEFDTTTKQKEDLEQ